ncbi:MAG TPA: heavy metal-responsive transcriptional regulator [Pyrinomonadaceae bacterium]
MSVNKRYLRAGELAQAAGVSTDTLHHYERKGVLPVPRRSPNGYREYALESLDRVRLVRRALAVGFTLEELARILKARDKGGAPCKQVRALAAAKLSELEAQLRDLSILRDDLSGTIQEWDARLSKTADGERARLLESLADAESLSVKHNSPTAPQWRKRKRKDQEQ